VKVQQHQLKSQTKVLEVFCDRGNINRGWENNTQNIKISTTEIIGYYRPKQHKPQLEAECSKLVDTNL
jgi:hypothetical protein